VRRGQNSGAHGLFIVNDLSPEPRSCAWHLPCGQPGSDLIDRSGHSGARRCDTCLCSPRSDDRLLFSCLSRDTCGCTGQAGRLAAAMSRWRRTPRRLVPSKLHMYILAQSKTLGGPHLVLRFEKPARVTDSSASWCLACCCWWRRRAKPSRPRVRCCCCSRRPRQPPSGPLHRQLPR